MRRLRTLGNGMILRGKRVLIRIDANVPVVKGKVVDGPHGRIARSAVDINWLSQRGAKVIVMAHLGRPKGHRVSAYSLKPVAKRLSSLLGTRVRLTRSIVGKDVEKLIEKMGDGDVVLLENLRFDRRERENDSVFAKELAALGDIYVNDAFGVSHRAHASLEAITKQLPSYAGPLLSQEVSVLGKLFTKSKKPFVLILGGLKMSTKLPLMERFIGKLDTLIIAGALANVFFVAQGHAVGKSVYEDEAVPSAKKLLKKHADKIQLPVDVVTVRSLRKDAKKTIRKIDGVQANDRIIDIGPQSIKNFARSITAAKTVLWNGPLGYCEIEAFCDGTRHIAKTIGKQTSKAATIVGGGDTLSVLESLKVAGKFTLLSTGGGALLQFLAGQSLPGVRALTR